MPLTTNTTVDAYRGANTPPAAPDVAAVAGYLRCVYPQGYEPGEGSSGATQITHVFDVPLAADIRDGAQTPGTPGGDLLYVPDQNGPLVFNVIFVARIGDIRRCWLRRASVVFPTTTL
ncbi:MAG: hypothetical protein U0793_14825 [Gemmataceae bacterium]|mgnify:CR=1 FL=1